MFHQWKSLATSFVVTIVEDADREGNAQRVARELLQALEPLGSKEPGDLRFQMGLQVIREAIRLAMGFCGQQSWYFVKYPCEGYAHGGHLSGARPRLYRAGGGGGESYNSFVFLG